jgi:glyoxylase-like metal-dependent hydrolase (beta-lactamase superfamily II)
MAEDLVFDRDAAPAPARLEHISPLVRRLVANNGGPFTSTGTCTYLVGHGSVTVIDPGPDDAAHRAMLLSALKDERIDRIVLTHTHRDHADGVAALKQATGARVYGCGPHIAARELGAGEAHPMDSSANRDYSPDQQLFDADVLEAPDHQLEAVFTPGHTANHLAFALKQDGLLFSGDHVMAWSTSIVAPPDGSMGDYMASLDKLGQRGETIYWPGHGGPVKEPHRFVRALIHHRRMRESSILNRINQGDRTTAEIVAAIYQNLDQRLIKAARLSVFAHLEDLHQRGLVQGEGGLHLDGQFVPKG